MGPAETQRMLQHNHWANAEVLRGLARLPRDLPAARALLAHIIAAELLWLHRIGVVSERPAVWPEWSLGQCEERLAMLPPEWDRVLASLVAPASGDREVAYTNSKGERFHSRVEDIVLHVLLHGSYHRGQVALRVRDAGGEPVYTDFIHAVRQGLVA